MREVIILLDYIKWTVGTFLWLFCAILIYRFLIFLVARKVPAVGNSKQNIRPGNLLFRAFARIPTLIAFIVLLIAVVVLYVAGRQFYESLVFSISPLSISLSQLIVMSAGLLSGAYLYGGVKVETVKNWIKSKAGIGSEITAAKKGFALIGGYDEVKKHLRVAVENILSDKSRVKTNGIVLYGPPGCGKTYFAAKTAEEFGLKYIKVHIDDIKSMWVNESASKVRQVFEKAIAEQPCVLVFEEMDEVLLSRADKSGNSEDNKVTNAFLSHMDDLRKSKHKVIVFGTTNYYEKLDKAAIRKGRFDYHIKIDKPHKEDLKEIIKSIISRVDTNISDNTGRSYVNTANSIMNYLIVGGVSACLAIIVIGSFIFTDGIVLETLNELTIIPRRYDPILETATLNKILSLWWLPAVAAGLIVVLITAAVLKKYAIVYINQTIAKGKQTQAAVQRIDIDRLSEHFEGRGVSDIESAINMAVVYKPEIDTELIIQADNENKAMRRNSVPRVSWDDVILNEGTKTELKKITTFISNYKSMRHKYTVPLKGMILHGDPGTGKTLIARAIASNADCAFYHLKLSDIVDKYVGETEKKLAEVYRQAAETAPSVVFIDEADSLFERRDTSRNSDAVNQILQEIDGFQQHYDVVFTIMATNHPEKIDEAIKSRLSYSLHIPKPDKEAREKLIRLFISKIAHSGQFDYANLAAITEGMSARDIENLINKASSADFSRPLQYRDIIDTIEKQKGTEKPVLVKKYTWDDLIVSDAVLKQLKAIETIFKNPDMARAMGISSGIHAIFYGEPGTGKTYAAKILANILNADFKEYSGGEFKKGIVGETERMIRDAFKWLRSRPAAVMFIDEADAILMDRTSYTNEYSVSCVNQFLAELQGFNEASNSYAVIISTNLLDTLDPAVKSRFPMQIYFGLPSKAEREKLFIMYLNNAKLKGVNVKQLSEKTEGYSGRDIANVINTAKINALSEGRDYLTDKDFDLKSK